YHSYPHFRALHSFPTRRSSDLNLVALTPHGCGGALCHCRCMQTQAIRAFCTCSTWWHIHICVSISLCQNQKSPGWATSRGFSSRSEEHTSELQSRFDLVCRLLL